MSDTPEASKPIKVFFSYAHQDEPLRDRLVKHLKVLIDKKTIEIWHDRQISAGAEWASQIDESLEAADVILLLVSSDFLNSNYCRDIETKRAMQRRESGEARVIPIILRPCEWRDAPFGELQALPPGGKPVTSWKNKDEAFAAIVQGIKRVIAGQDPIPPVRPNKRQKFLKWAIEERHWPLLLSFIIPLYFLINSYFVIDFGLHQWKLFILGGIALFIIGILYWAIRRQNKRLWPSGVLGIVGAGLIVLALTLPDCKLLWPESSNVNQAPEKPKLIVTIARFRPDFLTSRRYAKSITDKFQTALSKRQDIFTIKTYNAEVADEKQEEINAPVKLSDSCSCKILISAVVRRSNNKDEADFKLRLTASKDRPDGKEDTNAKLIEPRNIMVKNQEEYDSLVKLLVAYAYYGWGQWDDAIEILKQIRAEKGALLSETYFYEGLCRLNKGLQADGDARTKELGSACYAFTEASRTSNESISLDVTSKLNLTYTQIALSEYLQDKNEAAKALGLAIENLKKLSQQWTENKEIMGDCDPTKANLVSAYFQMYRIDGQSNWLKEAQEIVNGFRLNAACSDDEAICRGNLAQLLTEVGLYSGEPEKFENSYGAAIINNEAVLEILEEKLKESKDMYLHAWVTAVNNLANNLADLGKYLGRDGGRDGKEKLERANELYEKALSHLSKDKKNLDDWAWTKSNQAATLIDLGNLNQTDEKYYEDARKVCDEILTECDQSQCSHWISAKGSQALALCLLGSMKSDSAHQKELLESSLKACEEVSQRVKKNAIAEFLNEKTWGDVYFQLSLLSQDSYRANLKQAQSKYEDAKSFCANNKDMLIQIVCSKIDLKLNALSQRNQYAVKRSSP